MQKLFSLVVLILSTACIKLTNEDVTKGSIAVTGKHYFNCTNNGSESEGALYTFLSNGKLVIEIMYYDANNCTVASKRERNYFYGEYSYNSTTLEMTERTYKLEIAYLTSAEVAAQNASSQCGFNDWTVDVLKDVTDNEDCMGGTVYSNEPTFTYSATLNDSFFQVGTSIFTRINL